MYIQFVIPTIFAQNFQPMTANGGMQILVADFGERQRPAGRDGHARIRGCMTHKPRYKICMVLH